IKNEADTLIPDNAEQLVSPADIRNRIIDLADSAAFTAALPALANVAITGSYLDLANTPDFANVALSGAYSDLSGRPALANVATTGQYVDLINKPSFATVATSGSYNDLSNKPAFGSAALANTADFAPNTAVMPTRTITTSTGLTGGGSLASDRTIALNANSIASLDKADNAVAYNTLQGITYEQQSYARANIGADFLTPFRNKFINGRLDFWTRATSQTTSGYNSSDRFPIGMGGT